MEAIALDGILDLGKGGVAVKVVKVDVEGAEAEVLAPSKGLEKAAELAIEARGNERGLSIRDISP